MRPSLLLLALSACALFGCAPSIDCLVLVENPPPAKAHDASIRIFASADPECPYEEIAVLDAVGGDFKRGDENLFVSMMKDKAREVGGDAVITWDLKTVPDQPFSDQELFTLLFGQRKKQGGAVIRFKEDDCTE